MMTRTNLSPKNLEQLNAKLKEELAEVGFLLIGPNALENPIEQKKEIQGYLNLEKMLDVYINEKSPTEREIECLQKWIQVSLTGLTEQEKTQYFKMRFNETENSSFYDVKPSTPMNQIVDYFLEILKLDGIIESTPLKEGMDEDEEINTMVEFMEKYQQLTNDHSKNLMGYFGTKVANIVRENRVPFWKKSLPLEEKQTIEKLIWKIPAPYDYFSASYLEEKGIESKVEKEIKQFVEAVYDGPIYPNKIVSENTQMFFLVYTKEKVDQDVLLRYCESQL